MIDIKVGNTYLDNRGRKHIIIGYVNTLLGTRRNPIEDRSKVASQSLHFDRYTGKAINDPTVRLVDDLDDMSPTDAILYWENQRDLYVNNPNNSPLHLKLIAGLLENIAERIAFHELRIGQH